MTALLQSIDRASGYVFAGARGTDESGRTLDDTASIWAQAMSSEWTGKMEARDVQERWIERKDEIDEMERKGWEEEAKRAGALDGGERPAATVLRPDGGVETMEVHEGGGGDDDVGDLVAEQRKWEEARARGGGGDDGARVMRKR